MKSKKRIPEPVVPTPAATELGAAIPWWSWPLLITVTLVAYLPALRGPFLFDDLGMPMLGPTVGEPLMMYVRRGVRALTNLSLGIDRRLWDMNPFPYHLQNVVLHCVNGLLIFYIIRRVLSRLGRDARTAARIALFASAVFLLHPLQTEAVSYIVSRSEVLCALFTYGAIALFIRGSDTPAGWGRAFGILLLSALGIVSKEPAVAGIVVILVIDVLFHDGSIFAAIKDNWKLYVPSLAGAGIGSLRIIEIAGREGTAGASLGVSPSDYLFTQFQAIWVYLRLFLLPFGQNLDHAFPLAKVPVDLLSWLGLAGLVAVASAAWVWRKRFPLALTGLLVYLAMLAPTSSILPIADPLVERRTYLASLGLLLVLAELVSRVKLDHLKYAAICGVVLLLSGLTMSRNGVYGSLELMWEDSVRGNPKNWRGQFQLAFAYYQEGRCAESVSRYELAAQLQKPDYRMLVDWALALDCAGKADAAAQKLMTATTIEPTNSHAWSVLGMVLGKQNKAAAALEALNHALALNGGDANALSYRGNVYLTAGERTKAIADFEAALRLSPDSEMARRGLSVAQQGAR